MTYHCPKPNCNKIKLVWQPSKRRYYCPNCHLNFQLLEVAFIKGGKA